MPEYRDSFRFNAVVVVESLRSGEYHTGTELYEQVLVPAATESLSVELKSTPNAVSFRTALAQIAEDANVLGRWPILQIEAHGRQGVGLVLADDSVVTWEDLFDSLAAINRATRFNLLVVVSACWGGDLVTILRPARPAPVWALVGPSIDLSGLHLLISFKTLYAELLRGSDGVAAVKAMRAATDVGKHFTFVPAEIIFRAVFYRYIVEHCEGVPLQQRIDGHFAAILEVDPKAKAREAEVKEWLRARIDDHESHFDRLKAEHFMFEAIPENRHRIKCRYSDGPPDAYRRFLEGISRTGS